MFGQRLKTIRKANNILTKDIALDLGMDQSSISYFETREPVTIDLYLSYLAKQGIDLNSTFKIETSNTAKLLKRERQLKKIGWREICEYILISQSSLSYIENRADTNFFDYLRYLVNRNVDINSCFK